MGRVKCRQTEKGRRASVRKWVSDDLFYWWPMDEGSGYILNDASGNGRNGTLIDGASTGQDESVYWQHSIHDTWPCLWVGGNYGKVYLNYNISPLVSNQMVGDLVVSIWVRPELQRPVGEPTRWNEATDIFRFGGGPSTRYMEIAAGHGRPTQDHVFHCYMFNDTHSNSYQSLGDWQEDSTMVYNWYQVTCMLKGGFPWNGAMGADQIKFFISDHVRGGGVRDGKTQIGKEFYPQWVRMMLRGEFVGRMSDMMLYWFGAGAGIPAAWWNGDNVRRNYDYFWNQKYATEGFTPGVQV